MTSRLIKLVFPFTLSLSLLACSEARRDPCQLLSVQDVTTVDDSVTVSIWAGRDGELKDDEVCMFHTEEGDARLMLFVWYDKEADPWQLVAKGTAETGATASEVPGVGLEAAATFSNDELKLLAVKSNRGVVGIRIRKPVRRGSAAFNEVAQLAEKALSRY